MKVRYDATSYGNVGLTYTTSNVGNYVDKTATLTFDGTGKEVKLAPSK